MSNPVINFDSTDRAGMKKLRDQYGDSEMPFFGENQDGEKIIISINHENITTQTFQKNGWCRTNIYHADGDIEELFERM